MRTLRSFVSLLIFIGVCQFLYEAVKEWFFNNRFKISNIEEFGNNMDAATYAHVKAVAQTYISPEHWNAFSHLPAAAFPLILAAIFYVIFRICCLIAGIKPDDLYKRRRRTPAI